MIRLFVILALFLTISLPARCAIRAIPNLADLVYYSQDVVEAELIYFGQDSAVYATTSLYSPFEKRNLTFTHVSNTIPVISKRSSDQYLQLPQANGDTLFIPMYSRINLGINVEDAKRLFIFIPDESRGSIPPSLSDAFYQYQDDIYFPSPDYMDDGPLSIHPVDTITTWDQLKANILHAHAQIESFKLLLAEKAPSPKNNNFWFKWIEEQESDLPNERCPLTCDCGLGRFIFTAYTQIIESGDYKDAWKATTLAFKKTGSYISDQSGSYGNAEARNYFEKIAFSSTISTEERTIALWYFSQSMWYPQELKDKEVVPDKIRKEILITINKMKTLFTNESHQYFIVGAFESILESQNDELKMLAEQEALPFLVEQYLHHWDNYVHFELQDILYDKLTVDQLIRISGNSNGLLADIANVFIDTTMDRVSLNITVKVHDEKIATDTQVFFEKTDDPGLLISTPLKLSTEYEKGTRGGSFMMSYKDMKPGSWRVHVEGLAGEDSPMAWKSNAISFMIPRK